MMSELYYPWQPGWQVGMGFDPIQELTKDQAFSVEDSDLLSTEQKESDNNSVLIADESHYQAMLNFNLHASGGGWGAHASENASMNFMANLDFVSISVQDTWYSTISSNQVDLTKQKLSPIAANTLSQNPSEFSEQYGDFFIAGYISGGICAVTYMMTFRMTDFVENLSASFEEAFSDLGFSEETEENFQASAQQQNTSYNLQISTYFAGALPSKQVEQLQDIPQFISDYQAALPEGGTRMTAIVRPWTELSMVRAVNSNYSSPGLNPQDPYVNQLAEEAQQLDYVIQSADNWNKLGQYIGRTQHDKVVSTQQAAITYRQNITSFMETYPQNLTAEQIDPYIGHASSLLDQLKTETHQMAVVFTAALDKAYKATWSWDGLDVSLDDDGNVHVNGTAQIATNGGNVVLVTATKPDGESWQLGVSLSPQGNDPSKMQMSAFFWLVGNTKYRGIGPIVQITGLYQSPTSKAVVPQYTWNWATANTT